LADGLQFVILKSCHLGQATPVPLLAGETRGYERAHNLQGKFYSYYPRSQTEHIAVVVFA
jgi:hypothetical protein